MIFHLQVLLVPMRSDETNDLQAELRRLICGITYHECPTQKCRRRETIHQIEGQFLMRPKDLLVIKLNRVDKYYNKIHLPLHVQTVISFEESSYQLKSFLCHEGKEISSGHYRAYSYSQSGTVREFDDNCGGVPDFKTIPDLQTT